MTLVGDVWVYTDTKAPVADDPDRPCGHCGLANTAKGHDGCLGTACCGHGEESSAYIQLDGGERLGGQHAIRFAERIAVSDLSKLWRQS